MLELFLRRMSEPAQLVELMFRIPSRSEDHGGAASADSDSMNPFGVPPPALEASVAGVPEDGGVQATSMSSVGRSGRGNSETTRPSPPRKAEQRAPSPMELQSLLLKVATAEGIAKIKAMGGRTGKQEDVDTDGAQGSDTSGSGRVGEAAVEMLGRLTNQALSR